ncbi:hypothetical protein BJX76DRAFT_360719 [Aspergillus varians]
MLFSHMEFLTCFLCESQIQMPFVQSLKNTTYGFISCCDRQKDAKFESSYPASNSSHDAKIAPVKRPFTRLKSLPKSSLPDTGKVRRTGGRKSIPSRQQHEGDLKEKSYESIPKDILQKVFTYDIQLFGTKNDKVVYRRLLLDFQVNTDAVSDEIPKLLNLPIAGYKGAEVRLPNGSSVRPIGALEIQWQLYKGNRQYRTKFLVIENSQFDVLLGRRSIQKYRLSAEDEKIQKRLQYP